MKGGEIILKFLCNRRIYQKNILVKLKNFPFKRPLDLYPITHYFCNYDLSCLKLSYPGIIPIQNVTLSHKINRMC